MTPPKPPPAMTAPPPQRAQAAAPSADRPRLGRSAPANLGARVAINALEGWGKTSLAAYAPNPAIIQVKGETGYDTLLGAGRVPQVDTARPETWADLLAIVGDVTTMDQPYGTLALDALGGAERLCHEFVCNRDFKGDWGEKGFGSFQKGFDVSVTEWLKLLVALDAVRARGTDIILLAHAKVKPFKNPMGPDYDKWVSDVHDKTWGVTAKWCDAVLFGTFLTLVDKVQESARAAKGKGVGGTERILYTTGQDAFVAKNRYGMPELIEIPADPAKTYETVFSHIRKDR